MTTIPRFRVSGESAMKIAVAAVHQHRRIHGKPGPVCVHAHRDTLDLSAVHEKLPADVQWHPSLVMPTGQITVFDSADCPTREKVG